jgi:hypothetical protein
MKLAIVISGRINDDIEQYNNFQNTFFKNPVFDIFEQKNIFVCHSKTKNVEMVERFVQLYQPKIIVESDEEHHIDLIKYNSRPETNRYNTVCMYLNRFYLLQILIQYMKDNDVFYDCVISTRADILFENKKQFEVLNKILNLHLCTFTPLSGKGVNDGSTKNRTDDNNTIYIPNGYDYVNGINDQFAIGCFYTMSNYLSVYENIIPMLKSGVLLHPETLLRVHLEMTKTNIFRFSLNYILNKSLNFH